MSPRFISAALLFTLNTAALAANWPGWRGPEGTGVTSETALPLTWSATENVRWKIALPEPGNSTPIVWGGRIFLTQNAGNQRTLMCVDRKDGKVLWQAGPECTAAEKTHKANPFCAASPTTDGERVIAWFGSAGLYAWDFAGKELWHVDLGKQDHIWGYAGAPVLHGDLCILYFGPGPRSFLVAVNKRTGKEAWRVEAPETPVKERTDGFAGQADGVVGTWSVPLLVKAGGRDELVMTFQERMRAFDPQTGKELWSCGGISPLLYTSPMFGDGVLVGSGGYGGSTIAVKPGGTGDVTAQRLWQKIRDKQRIGSGVITGGHLYILNTPGTAQCIDLKTGETKWEERLTGTSGRSESWSSMVLSGERLYVLNQAGDTFVLKASPKFEKLATNAVGDSMTNASLAVSDGEFFIRTHQHLWCIGAGK
jgi:outer membrane protein assembly factor BamB